MATLNSAGSPLSARLPCTLDIEASGFGTGSYPIEVGFVREDGLAWCSLIQPAGHWTHWDPKAEALHHIGRHTLVAHGRPVVDVALQLNRTLAGRTVYCDGWAHDYTWLGALFNEADLQPHFRLESVRSLLDETALSRLDQCQREAFNVLSIDRHRASSDARALQWALVQLGASAPPAAR